MFWRVALFLPCAALATAYVVGDDQSGFAQNPLLNIPAEGSYEQGTHTFAADAELPTVDLGYTKHKAIPNPNSKLWKFQSIRYAAPPVGNLRFKAPQPPAASSADTVEDGKGKKECLQATVKWAENFPDDADCPDCECCLEENADGTCKTPCGDKDRKPGLLKLLLGGLLPNLTDPLLYSEDCLYLDVWAPKEIYDNPDKEKFPVFVWIYGGAYVFGGKTLYFPGGLLERSLIDDRGGMIFVAMNYRMGALGFAAGKDIKDEDVNAGLLDQQMALKWVQQHISKFGGDPDQVTVAGLSAGGGSVIHHLTAYKGTKEKLFKQAISFSGGWQPITNKTIADETFNGFMELAGAKSLSDLHSMSEDKIRQANYDQISKAPPGTFLYNPTAWGDFAPASPSKLLYERDMLDGINVMISHTFDEGGRFAGAFEEKNTSLDEFIDLALPDLDEDEREYVKDTYGTDEPDHVDISRIIGDVTFRCPVTYVADALYGNVFWHRWNTVKSNGHGGDLLYLFYKPLVPVRSVRAAHILQDYAVTFTMYGFPFTSVETPIGWPNPVPYNPSLFDGKVQYIDSGLLNVPKVIRGTAEDQNICRVWQSFDST